MRPIGKSIHIWNLAPISVIVFITCSAACLHAQGYASIVGTVSDSTGAILQGATVTVTQTTTGNELTTKSGKDGSYVFPALLPSTYSLRVTAHGFETYNQENILLQADQAQTVLINLKTGASTETVTVTGAPPQLDTTNGTLSQVIGGREIVDLPLNGRNAAALETQVAGVVVAPANGLDQGAGKTFAGQGDFTSNGAQNSQSTYLLNGGNNLDEMTNIGAPFPMPDDLQEFSVQTSSYSAMYGQAAGAVVNIVTKSGAEKFHGDAFEFIRNGYFDAKAWNSTADTLHRHQFGGTIGGPVLIPKISQGKSTQFFFGYQYTQIHQASNAGKATVPTAAEEGLDSADAGYGIYGDFSAACSGIAATSTSPGSPGGFTNGLCNTPSQQIYDPFDLSSTSTGECSISASTPLCPVPFLNNEIPLSRWDQASKAFLQDMPHPTLTPTGAPSIGLVSVTGFSYLVPNIQTFQEFFGRVDHQFGDKDHLFGDFFHDNWTEPGVYTPTSLLNYTIFTSVAYSSALLAETHTFTGNILNNLVVNYQREISLRGGVSGSPCITAFGVTGVYQPPENCVINQVNISGFTDTTGKAYADWLRNNYTFNDDVHWIKGAHDIGFGGHIELSKFDLVTLGNTPGEFSFGSTTTPGPNYYGPTSSSSGGLAAFEVGAMSNFTQGAAEFIANRNHFPGLYIQDNWKVNQKLTLNYGLRWESFVPWENQIAGGQNPEFLPSNYTGGIASTMFPNLPIGMAVSGDAGVAKYGLKDEWAKWMPRVGFAYDVSGNGKTVVRAGAGLFYQTRLSAWQNLNQGAQAPYTFTVQPAYPGGINPGGPFSNPYGTGLTANTGSAASGGATAGPINNPFPFTLPLPSASAWPKQITLYEFDPTGNFHVPSIGDFNLIVEHQLLTNTSMRLAYVGSISRHNLVSEQINPAVSFQEASISGGTPSTAYLAAGLSDTQRYPYNGPPNIGPCISSSATVTGLAPGCASGQAPFSNMLEWQPTAAGNYNSFQATVDQRISHGLSFKLNFTWSKALDDLPNQVQETNIEDLNPGESYVYPEYPAGMSLPSGAATINFENPKALDFGPSDFNHKLHLTGTYDYALPKLQQGNAALRYVVNGWRASGVFERHSGDMLTLVDRGDTSGTGLLQDRALLTGATLNGKRAAASNCLGQQYCRSWINPAAAVAPTIWTTAPSSKNSYVGVQGPGYSTLGFGNSQKANVQGPAGTDLDVDAFRDFPLRAFGDFKSYFEFRAEYFNVFNHPQLADPQVAVTSTLFGSIGGTATGTNSRLGEFSLKYIF
ncbi:MAG: carboxypeptidase-like regulatory domain-containing protein [Terracidiphilus sp.]|jgi:hypothetical protein